MEFRVGCSGWSYAHWRGDFYPLEVPKARWLEHYASQFDTVELNTSFYRLPAVSTVGAWARRVPAAFTFAVKASRLITHYRRLGDCASEVETFSQRFAGLGAHLGPVLYQLPPDAERDDGLLAAFLDLLPTEGVHAFEFRHSSWWVEPVFDLLRRHGASFVIYNLGGATTPLAVTAPDVYVRFHGPSAPYASHYTADMLARWAEQLHQLDGARRVWAYFNNDAGGYAPWDAASFRDIVADCRPRP